MPDFKRWAVLLLVFIALPAVIGTITWGLLRQPEGRAPVRSVAVDGDRIPASQMQEVVRDLCEASRRARADPADAGELFNSEVHGPLHLIAKATEAKDRSAATRLLEAKFEVEQSIARGSAAGGLAGSLDRLLAATRPALASLAIDSPYCPQP